MVHGSLGPFPKTLHLAQIVGQSLPKEFRQIASEKTDLLICGIRADLDNDLRSDVAVKGMKFLTDLIFSTRHPDPAAYLKSSYGAFGEGSKEEMIFLMRRVSLEHPAISAAVEMIADVMEDSALLGLFEQDHWEAWRKLDGSGFCDFARAYFAKYLRLILEKEFRQLSIDVDQASLAKFAGEASTITRAFSARWFNACARFMNPDIGSVRWYFRHCLGKLDLETERETSHWVEPIGNPWSRRQTVVEPGFDL